jgi:hypothetical protein
MTCLCCSESQQVLLTQQAAELQKRSDDLDERERRLKAKESSIKSRQRWSVSADHPTGRRLVNGQR